MSIRLKNLNNTPPIPWRVFTLVLTGAIVRKEPFLVCSPFDVIWILRE